MTRSALVLVAAALAFVLTALPAGTGIDETTVLLVGIGALALGVAHLAAARRRRLGSLERQFQLGIGVVVGMVILAAAVAAGLMFVDDSHALMIVGIALFAGLVAVRAAQLFAGGVLKDIEAVRDGLEAVRAGRRPVRIDTEADDEVGELAVAANAMVVRLAEQEQARDAADSARRTLVAAVSHDLRTPLTSLRLLCEAIEDEIVDAETRRRYLKTMRVHVGALGALVDDLFELSRLEAGDVEWAMERVRMDELVGETVEAIRVEAEQHGVALLASVPDGLAAARANPERVQRVLFNLIQNAIRHTPSDGSVTVRAHAVGGGELEVEVADTGEGIAALDRQRVFEPFFRGGAEASRTRAGAGLGLAIAAAIVQAHGGRIWLADCERGTSVRFSLPAAA